MASSSATSHPTPAPQGVPGASAGGGFKLKFKLGGLSASATSSSSSGSASTNRVALASSSAPSVVPSVVPSHPHARAHAPAANTTPVASTSTLSSYPTVSAAGPSIIKLTQPSITLAHHHHHHHHHRKPAAPSLSAHPVTATATTAATTTTAAPQRNRASSDASTSTSSSEASGSSVPSSPVVERPRPSSSLPPIALSSARPVIVRKPEPRDPEVQHKLDREFRGVTSAKYRKLKRAYDEVVETRDQAQYTLHRSQKIISRLQDEKRSLLDRVQLLERAAGITTSVAQQASSTSATPLLDPPNLPSLADRPRELPLLTTATDITDSSYADPVGPKLLPSDLPPRRRSHHLTTHLAAEKLKESPEARERAAAVASKNEFALVSLLGAQGAEIAENVTRALNGEKVGVVQVVVAGPATSTSTTTTSSGKRKRDGPSSNSKKSSMSTVQPKSHEHLSALPNPFAAAGATPLPDPIDPFPHLVGADNDLFDDSINSPALSRDGFGAITDDDDPYDIKPGTPSSSALAMPVPAPTKKAAPHKKAKRQKVSVVTPGVHTIPFVPRYGDGQPILPLPFGTMVLRNLGTVDHRDAFHTERYIFPVGYEASRKYPSMIDPKTTVEYVCKVIEGDNNGPQFEVYPEDQPGVVITGTTATSAWSQIVKAVNVIRSRSQSNSVSGPDYFGLSHNLVKALVQELPGANQVVSYIWQTFVEDPDPALAEANKKRNRSSASVGPMMDGVGLSGPGGLRRSTMDGMPGDYGLSPMMYPSSTGSPGNPSVFDPTLHQPQHYGSPIQHSSSSFNPSLMHSHSGANDPYALPSGSPSASTSSYYAPDPYAIPPSSSNAWGVDPSLDSTYGHRSSHHHHLMHHDTSLDPSFTTSTDSSSSLSHNPYGLPPPNF